LKAIFPIFGLLSAAVIIAFALAPARHQPPPAAPAAQAASPNNKAPAPAGDNVVVLMFHDVSSDTGYPPDEHRPGRDPAIETPQELAGQLLALIQNGYHVISLDTFHRFLRGQAAVPPKAVLLTFDDGYEGTYTYVTPLLEKYHLTATCFMITGWWDPAAHMQSYWHYLTLPQARSMLASGVWSFGGHTFNGHYRIPAGSGGQTGWFYDTPEYLSDEHRMETTAEYEQRVLSDAMKMTGELRAAGVTSPVDFAWPSGHAAPAAKRILINLGYRYFYTMTAGVNRPDPAADSWDVYRVYPGYSAAAMLSAIRAVEKGPGTARGGS